MEKIIEFVVYSLDFLAAYFLSWVAVCYFMDVLPTDLSKQTSKSVMGLPVSLRYAGAHRKITPVPAAAIHETVTRSKKNIYVRKK